MLKKRINYLCEKKDISRKSLVYGLVTLSHFSNILSGRYILPDDVAEEIGERLDVNINYLLNINDISDKKLRIANELIEKIILDKNRDDTLINSIPELDDSLTLELIYNFCKASLYLRRNDYENFMKIYDNYIKFYLNEFGKEIVNESITLVKAYYYFMIEFHRYNFEYEKEMAMIELLIPLLEDNIILFTRIKLLYIEACIHSKKYDPIDKIFDEVTQRVNRENALYLLTALYLAKSAFVYALKLKNDALIYLSMAEENIIHTQDKDSSELYFSISNNRILILIELEELKNAYEEIKNLELSLSKNRDISSAEKAYLSLLRLEVHLKANDFTLLSKELDILSSVKETEEHNYSFDYYNCHLLFNDERYLDIEPILKKNIEYYEKNNNIERVIKLCELIAAVYEHQKKYKLGNEYYKKVVSYLKS